MRSYIKTIKNSINFSGRTSRKEYWYFALCSLAIGTLLAVICGTVRLYTYLPYYTGINSNIFPSLFTTSLKIALPSLRFLYNPHFHSFDISITFWKYFGIYNLILFLPTLSITIRRLHDIGKAGVYFLINLIPFIGWTWLLILMTTKGNSNENKYGKQTI